MAKTTYDSSTYDLFMEYDGRDIGIILARDENGVMFVPGFAPNLQQQFKTGTFGYENVPSEIDTPVSWEDWRFGAGFQDDPDGTPSAGPRGYNFSRGVDVSHGNRAYLSPERQNPDAVFVLAPVKYLQTSVGFFAIAATSIYEWNSTVWVERDDASGDSENYTDIIQMDGIIYAARGSGADYKYSADGITWTAFTDSDDNPDFFVVRGVSSAQAVLWMVKANGDILNTTDGQNSGVAWSAADSVGDTSLTLRGLFTLDDDIYTTFSEKMTRYTGTITEEVWGGGVTMNRNTNGQKPFVWNDQKAYVPYGDRLMQFDPNGPFMDPVWPSEFHRGSDELNGEITAIAGDGDWLYLAIKNLDGNTYICKFNPYRNNGIGELHTYFFLGANDCNALSVQGAGANAASSTNPTLHLGYGNDSQYVILTRPNTLPEDDGAYRYDTAGGYIVTGWHPWGAFAYPKFLNGGKVTGYALTESETVEQFYEVDQSGVPVSILTATVTGRTIEDITNEVSFSKCRLRLNFTSASNQKTPIVQSALLHATPKPPRKRVWTFVAELGPSVFKPRGGAHKRVSARDTEAFLFGSANRWVKLRDPNTSKEFIVHVLDVQGTVAGASGS